MIFHLVHPTNAHIAQAKHHTYSSYLFSPELFAKWRGTSDLVWGSTTMVAVGAQLATAGALILAGVKINNSFIFGAIFPHQIYSTKKFLLWLYTDSVVPPLSLSQVPLVWREFTRVHTQTQHRSSQSSNQASNKIGYYENEPVDYYGNHLTVTADSTPLY